MLLGVLLSGFLAAIVAFLVDVGSARAGLLPPGFEVSSGRRMAGMGLLTLFFFLTFFSIYFTVADAAAQGAETFEDLQLGQLLIGQVFLLTVLAAWYVLGYIGVPSRPTSLLYPSSSSPASPSPSSLSPLPPTQAWPMDEVTVDEVTVDEVKSDDEAEEVRGAEAAADEVLAGSLLAGSLLAGPPTDPGPYYERGIQLAEKPVPVWLRIRRRLGLDCDDLGHEIWIGLLAGFGAWLFVLVVTAALAWLFHALGLGETFGLEEPPSGQIVWMASQSIFARLLISLSAGVSEELFFRGFLQPRIGVVLSTMLFAISHAGYGQPMLLISVTILSLIYAELYRRRGNVWAAMTAHTFFDAIQLLLVIPAVLHAQEAGLIAGG